MSLDTLGARHQRVQRLRRLLHRSGVRETEHAFVAEGLKLVAGALGSSAGVEAVFVGAEGGDDPSVLELAERAQLAGARVFVLAQGVMERVADTATPQPICAVVAALDVPLGNLIEAGGNDTGRPLVVCAGVRDPGNLGALIRTAGAAGAAGVVSCSGSVDLYNPKVVRASAGAIFEVPLARGGDAAEVVCSLSRAGYRVLAAAARGGIDYTEAPWGARSALLLGNEAHGLPDTLVEAATVVTIPMEVPTESLNVAMAATVMLFEAARRRRLP
ncbi:MAG: TrmH family RNA methyltransferase [Acidimicrobiales bacterium]